MKKWWGRSLFVLGILAALILLAFVTSNHRGKSAVAAYRAELRAAGEKLELNELIPPRPDPSSNSVEIFHKAILALGPDLPPVLNTNPPSVMRMVGPGKALINWQQPEVWSGSKTVNTWEDIEAALEPCSEALHLLYKLADNPMCVFDVDYEQGISLWLPHWAKQKQLVLLLSAATMSDLHRGDTSLAVTNVHAMLGLAIGWKDEPLLISLLVRDAMIRLTFATNWELLQATNLTDEKLALLQQDWASLDFLQPMANILQMERVLGSLMIQSLRTSKSPAAAVWSGFSSKPSTTGPGTWLDRLKKIGESTRRKTVENLWRTSWSYTDELNTLRASQVLLDTIRQIQVDGSFKKALEERDRRIGKTGQEALDASWLRDKLDNELLNSVGSVAPLSRSLDRLLLLETAKSLSQTAIALKRYQLAHNRYPNDLPAMVPEFMPEIPRDPVDGEPLRYQLKEDGTFLLYSIGQNGNDDHGDAASSSRSHDWSMGRDWVWPQPATAEEIEEYWEKISSP